MHSQKSKSFILFSVILVGTLIACGLGSQSQTPSPAAQAQATPTPKVEATATPANAPDTPTPAPTDTVAPTMSTTEEPTEAATPEAEATTSPAMSDATPALPAFPLPDDAQAVEFSDTDLTFTSATSVVKLVEFYRQALTPDGWQEDSTISQVLEAFGYVEFNRGDEVVSLTLTQTGDTTDASVDLSQAASLLPKMEEEPMVSANAPGYTINDWPVPDEATEVNKSGDKLSFNTPLKLTEIAEFYRSTFEKVGASTDCLDTATEYTSMSCSLSNGDFSLNFFAFEASDHSEVEISFTNSTAGASSDGSSSDSSGGSASGQLTAVDKDGLPVPSDYANYSGESSPYRRTATTTSPSALKLVLEFYRSELSARQWHELPSTVGATDTQATLLFENNEPSRLELKLTQNADGGTDISLIAKMEGGAKKDGILPPAGQARIYFGNITEGQVVFAINQKEIKVGVQDPSQTSMKGVPFIDVSPGEYDFTLTQPGEAPAKDKVAVGSDETWALVAGPGGALALQMY